METTLHRQLKSLYAGAEDRCEVAVDGYRIDAVVDGRLIEVQSAPLGAIRDKVRALLERHDVLIVKPLAARKTLVKRARARKTLVKRARARSRTASVRQSPKRETIYDLFPELVHFIPVFPHPRLTLQVLLTEQEEQRVAVKRRRWKGRDYRVTDRRLVSVTESYELRTAADLLALLPASLPARFSTADVARELRVPRWLAQKMAYCLRRAGGISAVDKIGNSWLYECQGERTRAA